ncbi:hypothetical protein CDAR_379591 [Caerostris darwini]|uniref:Uncharacterized protein n=1 Tax=Caerostris darwini TaxID=1538125 RepID=A0AAV4RKX9_9ARAC|nr:hypothetical protein CDAR_379591 [Caerostris darwini]
MDLIQNRCSNDADSQIPNCDILKESMGESLFAKLSSPCCGFASGDSFFYPGILTKEMLSSGLGETFSWDSSSVSRVLVVKSPGARE